MRDYQRGVLGDRIATLRVHHAASHRFVMFGADGVGFRSAAEPVGASFVCFLELTTPLGRQCKSPSSMPPQPDQLRLHPPLPWRARAVRPAPLFLTRVRAPAAETPDLPSFQVVPLAA